MGSTSKYVCGGKLIFIFRIITPANRIVTRTRGVGIWQVLHRAHADRLTGAGERWKRETNDIIKSIRINSNCFVRRGNNSLILNLLRQFDRIHTAANETEIIIIIMAPSPAVVLLVLIRTNGLTHISQ